MKIGRCIFSGEELVLCLLMEGFFVGMLIGSFHYGPEARLFPLLLAIPGTVLVALYLLRGHLPPNIEKVVTGAGQFMRELRSTTESYLHLEEPATEDSPAAKIKSYLIFVFTSVYILLSYLIGFYLSTLLCLASYFLLSRRDQETRVVSAIILAAILLALVYVFDRAFGYHFGRGVLFGG